MTFLKKMLTKKYDTLLDQKCDYCGKMNKKNKTCDDCSKKICVNCYKENILCINCDERYNEWAEKLQNLKNESEKKEQYSEAGQDLELHLLI
ncbi:uncharacterized protein METZ01_LOCUS34290 [marine metagenome]|uniref:Uncharacterized protein n=1 Tax=marine metagenome TaxID=408172 RepID=A0A381QQ16_9ZZZZ